MKVNLIYGTDNGNTRSIAKKIAKRLPEAEVIHISKAKPDDFETCDLLILGSPTYGFGELSDDWITGIALLSAANLNGKTVALFGTGDQLNYPDTFADAMGILYEKAVERGANVVGHTETGGYDFDKSTAIRDGHFVGLVLDQDNQANKTEERIESWLGKLL
ncbi:MAG TPA: flavodoxin FldA [Candidatus Sulfotelmatobacter sp.]|jgi:flavodoxin I|nr:flavodoxin FldA [Candidatus Sulfotelmatobacter sp.]